MTRWQLSFATLAAATFTAGFVTVGSVDAHAAPGTTAWQNGIFVVDTPDLVRRSDIVLGRPNTTATESVPLGNGQLGAAVWAAGGFTAQLNRVDTVPDRKSPGQVVVPGLARLTSAADYRGRLDLYDGMFRQSGGGMTATSYVRADTQQLVVEVTGADPNATQTAQVRLWSGRQPTARAAGGTAVLAETWVDNTATGSSGRTFGTLAGISAGGRNVSASTPDSATAQVSFQPDTNGSFRVVVAAPAWTGGDPIVSANAVLDNAQTRPETEVRQAHLAWWHDHWQRAGLIKITSADGSGDYVENLRTIFLYASAAQSRGPLPGSQAGVANLFTWSQDRQDWYPAGYWFWNLRMQMAANLAAGVPALNDPLFRLYRDNVSAVSAWTSAHFPGRQGMCVPETLRFNGNGYYAGGDAPSNASCDSTIAPSWNSLNVTTGAEIGLWIWQHYQFSDDRAFLSANYPLIRGAAEFLLSHATTGADGRLHTFSNAHETQWGVNDPTTDIAAMQSFFPVAVRAAQTLGVDADLSTRLNTVIGKIPPLSRTDTATQTQLLGPESDAAGTTMIGLSAQPTAPRRNSENIGLEAVWPYSLIGDSTLTAVGRRTFTSRPYVNSNSWSYDGLLRIAPAWPSDWTGEGTVAIPHNSRVHVQVAGGTPATVAISSGANQQLTVRNPWPGQNVSVVDGQSGAVVVGPQTSATITIPAQPGRKYLVERTGSPTLSQPFAALSGAPATAARRLDQVSIGLPGGTAPTGTVSLRSRANNQFVSAPNGSALIANQPGVGVNERFDLIDRGNGEVSLRARSNNLSVAAENAGAAPLIANRTALGPWETFLLVRNPDGTVSFLARANNRYVCAENAGTAPLIANRTAIGTWEKFDLISN